MATTTVSSAEQAANGAQSYTDYANHLSYMLHEVAYQAQAARALLHEHDQTEADETLTGVSYLLNRLQEDCKKLSEDVCGTWHTYRAKDEIGRSGR